MKVLDSNIGLSSEYKNIQFNYEKLDIKIIKSTDSKTNGNINIDIKTKSIKANLETVNLNKDAMDENELKTFIIKFLVEKLTGKKIKTLSTKEFNEKISNIENIDIPQVGAQIEYEKINYKSESVNFRANGKIITKKGKEINFDISFSLSREILEYTHLDIKAGSLALIDPLIINLDGNIKNPLSNVKFTFDLDADGKKDSIPLLAEGYGFLVFDKNQNNKVDNGSELFGVKTGDGFGELKIYDKDKNNWIDEEDEIFDKLKVWIKTTSQDKLYSLKDLGIGAIYLDKVKTPFSLDNGFLRESSIYLKENGKSGIVSKVDLKRG